MNGTNLGILVATVAVVWITSVGPTRAEQPLDVLILDGTNPYHEWQVTTPLLQHLLRESGRFRVEVATAPGEGEDMSGYRPQLADYDVLVCNYGDQRPWPKELQEDFVRYVRDGGGFVCFHSACNAFAEWPEYNDICGLGGWYGRDEKSGPYAYFRDGKLVRDTRPAPTGHHGPQHEYQVRDAGPGAPHHPRLAADVDAHQGRALRQPARQSRQREDMRLQSWRPPTPTRTRKAPAATSRCWWSSPTAKAACFTPCSATPTTRCTASASSRRSCAAPNGPPPAR